MAKLKTDLAATFQMFGKDENQFRTMIDSLPAAIYTTDAEGNLTHFNPAAVKFSGYVPELGNYKWCVTWKLFWPDGRPMPHDTCPMAIALKEKRSIQGTEAIAEKPNGERVWFEAYPSPILDKEGNLIGGINMLLDITERKKRDEALKQSEQRLETTLNAGEIGSWEWNIESNTIYWSEKLEELHGMQPGEFDGKFESFLSAIHPDDREELLSEVNRAIKKNKPYQIEHRWICQNGDVLWFNAKGTVKHNNSGKPVSMVGTCVNITTRKKNDLLQKIQNELLEKIATGVSLDECLASLCSAVSQLSPDTRAAILLANEKREFFTNVIAPDFPPSFREEVVGTNIKDSRSGTCVEAILSGHATDCTDIKNDDSRSTDWKNLCIANNFNACRSNPILGENGKPLGTFMICFNEARKPNEWEERLSEFGTYIAGIALERDQSRHVLKESEDRFRNTMEQSPLSMQIFDAEGKSIMVNPAWEKMWNASEEEIGDYNILHDEQLEEFGIGEYIRKAFAGEVVKLPTTYYDPAKIGKSGRDRWIEGYMYPLTSEDSERNEVALVHRDVTEQVRAEKALRDSEAQLEEELIDSTLLQDLSTQLIEEENIESLYEKIIDAAIAIMRSDFASLQIYHPERGKGGELRLLSQRGFSPEAAKFWEWVKPTSDSTCGLALRTGKRVIASDIETTEFMQGTEDQEVYLNTGIHSVLTTPLHSRNGNLLGMISTHWKESHKPSEHSYRLLDILSRQAADLMERKQTEQELSKSEKMYRTLFESIEEGYCIIEMIFDEKNKPKDYRFLEINPAFEKITEIQNAIGKTMLEVYPNLDKFWFEAYGEVAQTGKPAKFEKLETRVGKWLQVYAFRFGKAENNQVAVLFSDISQRKSNEHSNALLSAIVNGSEDAIISKDMSGIITSWNNSAERLFDYTEEEAVGKHITLLFPKDRIHEEDKIQAKIRKGEGVDHFETIRLRKDGTPIHVSLTISPIHDAEGNIIGASKIVRDITKQIHTQAERERLLQEVEREQQMLSEVFQNAPSFMCILKGPEHVFERANELYFNLIGDRDIIGKPVREALPEAEGQAFFNMLDQVYQTGEPFSGTDMIVRLRKHPDSALVEYNVDFVYQPIRDPEGNITGIFVQGIDLTERNRAKAELKAINETLEERVQERTATLLSYQDQLRALASQLSKAEEQERERLASDLHDNLGQLLAVGKMKIDLLLKDNIQDETVNDINELASLMDDAIKYTRQLMTDLKPPPSLDKENLNASINWIANKMKKHNLEVIVEDDGEFKPLDGEVLSTLRQSIQELLFNVIKHANVSKANIHLMRKGKSVEVTVVDNGQGFESDADKIKPDENGGFGLFNITERMNLLGGEVEIESDPENGTKVVLTAPLIRETAIDEELEVSEDKNVKAAEKASKPKNAGAGIKVLVCDDHPMMREGLRKMIEEEDDLIFIAEATNGEDAIQLCAELNPDVVVMDVNMPGMNGIEATREIANLSPSTRIIGLSLHDNIEVAQAMRNAGASAYLTKADVFETLCATIRVEAQAMKKNGQDISNN